MSQPCLLDDQALAVLLQSHLLQEYVHDDERHDGEQLLVLLDGIHLEDDEGLIEQGAIDILIEYLVVLAALVEVLEHVGEVVAVDGGDVVFDTYLVETLTGKLIERVERQCLHCQRHAPILQSLDEFLHLVVYLRQLRAAPLLHGGEVLSQCLLL